VLLENGTKIEGIAAGVPGVSMGFLSHHNGHDYINRLTDPSSAGQVCSFTMPEVGVWGVNTENCESGKPWVKGIIARELCHQPMNWRSAETLDYFLRRNFVIGVSDVDTPALKKYAADHNIRKCAVVTSPGFTGWEALGQQIRSLRYENTFPAAVNSPRAYGSPKKAWAHVAICDFGSSYTLARLLNSLRIRSTLLPPYDAATTVARGGYDGFIVAQGAGSPRNHPGISETLRPLMDTNIPILGVGLGFLYIAAACGVQLREMKHPHGGAWYPVTCLSSGKTFFTRQCHEYTLASKLPDSITVTHKNYDAGTIEGFSVKGKPILARQYLPCSDIRIGGTGEMLGDFIGILKGRL